MPKPSATWMAGAATSAPSWRSRTLPRSPPPPPSPVVVTCSRHQAPLRGVHHVITPLLVTTCLLGLTITTSTLYAVNAFPLRSGDDLLVAPDAPRRWCRQRKRSRCRIRSAVTAAPPATPPPRMSRLAWRSIHRPHPPPQDPRSRRPLDQRAADAEGDPRRKASYPPDAMRAGIEDRWRSR